jgi:phosphohistidine phosphatase SixA
VLRHAPAEHRNPRRWRNDDLRPLRPEGREQFAQAARGLARLLAPSGKSSVSPLNRAHQTAELLGRRWVPARRPEIWEELRPEAPASALLERVAGTPPPRGDRLLVGHEPQLSRFVGLATTGDAVPVLRFSKGGAVALEFADAFVPGGAKIGWALTRSQLGRLGPARDRTPRDDAD